jgi:diguanylate cyclase (GGDEF)-like protein
VAVPDAVLLKPGALTAEERAVMQTHARVGFEMLSGSGSDLLDLAATIALTHHERYDGGGYPQGLRGEDIPLPGRIVAVADVFDALTSKRVYKDAMPTERAIEVIREGRGTQFDPRVVDAFDRAIAASVHSPAERPLAPASEAEVPDDRRAAGPGEAAGTREGRPGVLGDARRLAALRELAILDTPAESDFDDVARLAAAVCRSPVAAVNFVDGERHFTKAVVGMPEALGGSVRNDLSFCAATVQSRDGVLAIPDTRTDDHWRDHPMVAGGPGLGFYMGASIHSAGERVGVVCAFGTEPRTVTAQDREALVTLARQVERHLEVRRRNTELRDLALTDPLTGLANRTLLYDRLQHALAHRSRVGRGVGVLYCDVDDFKGINDRLGHEEGDALLCDIAATLRSVARASDTVARIAGDEFVIVCPHVDHQSDLDTVRTRLEEAIAWQRPLRDGSPPPRVSVGAVLADPGDSAADILRRADHAMYGAKRRTHRVAVV